MVWSPMKSAEWLVKIHRKRRVECVCRVCVFVCVCLWVWFMVVRVCVCVWCVCVCDLSSLEPEKKTCTLIVGLPLTQVRWETLCYWVFCFFCWDSDGLVADEKRRVVGQEGSSPAELRRRLLRPAIGVCGTLREKNGHLVWMIDLHMLLLCV